MSNKAVTLLLSVFGVLLLILIVVTFLTSSIFNKKGAVVPTPTPISSSDSDVQTQDIQIENSTKVDTLTPLNHTLTADEANSLIQSSDSLNEEDGDKLTELVKDLPTEGNGFTLNYTIAAGHVTGFIATTTGLSGTKNLISFLSQHGLSKLFSDKNIFTVVNEQGEEQSPKNINNNENTNQNSKNSKNNKNAKKNPSGKDAKTKDEKLLTDFGKTLLSFDFTKKEEPNNASGSGGVVGDTNFGTSGSAQAILNNPRVSIYPGGRSDLQNGAINQNIINIIASIAERHTMSICALKTGHSVNVSGTSTRSLHADGKAVDICVLDGQAVSPGHQVAHALVAQLATQRGALSLNEVGSPWPEFNSNPGFFSNSAHQNHIHIGVN